MLAFFKVSVAGSMPQTIVFKLDNDKCPKTCDNFIALCQSRAQAKKPTAGASSSDVVEPTYRGTEFHRIVPGFMIQGGDFTSFNGKGGYAAPTTNEGKSTFPDECFDVSHNREGILSMANRGKDTNGSQFFITLGKALHLDGKHVAFGAVVRGMECVKQIAEVETDGQGKPVKMQRVAITDCGIGTGDDDSDSSSSSSSSSSASSAPKKKHRRRSKKKRNRSDHSSHPRQRDRDDDDHSNNKKRKKKKPKEKTSHRHRKRDSSRELDETSQKRHRNDDERHKRRRH